LETIGGFFKKRDNLATKTVAVDGAFVDRGGNFYGETKVAEGI
jgi:hypothetical protein